MQKRKVAIFTGNRVVPYHKAQIGLCNVLYLPSVPASALQNPSNVARIEKDENGKLRIRMQ